MQVLYIDDNEIDARYLAMKARAYEDFVLTTSNSLTHVASTVLPDELDCLLIDINRPDAVSIEEDVAKVRNRSNVPIIFVTGGEANDFRSRAQLAGAEAVVDKRSLSVELVQQLAVNARGRGVLGKPASTREGAVDRFSPTESRLLLLDYLDVCLWRRHRDQFATDIRRSIRAMRFLSGQDRHEGDGVELGTRLKAVSCELAALADRRMTHLSIEMNEDQFAAIGPSHCVEMGLICLIGGLIRAGPLGNAVSARIFAHNGGPAILFSSTNPIPVTLEDLYQTRKPHDSRELGIYLAICSGIALLGLRQDQIHVTSHGDVQQILMH